MNKDKIIELVKVAIKEIIKTDKEITGETRLFEDLNLDSTSIIEFLMALEDTVSGLYIDPEELSVEHFQSVNTIADYILAHIGNEVN